MSYPSKNIHRSQIPDKFWVCGNKVAGQRLSVSCFSILNLWPVSKHDIPQCGKSNPVEIDVCEVCGKRKRRKGQNWDAQVGSRL